MHAKCAAEMQTTKTQMTAMRSELEAQRLKVAAQIEETENQNKMQELRMTEERRRWHAEAQTQKAQIEALRRKLPYDLLWRVSVKNSFIKIPTGVPTKVHYRWGIRGLHFAGAKVMWICRPCEGDRSSTVATSARRSTI